ncbi:RING finger family 4 domain-containing protein [Streptomyces sp. NPDC045714]|uniref:RING finger family 4 domain-containing protein n=1 Tax=Streptomyces sp. NPDC045714 TaxID=3154913 RepID=UPI003408F95A
MALEAELLDRGFALTPGLHTALASLGPAGLADAGKQLVRHIDAELGADRTHMPLFRSFPASVPDDTLQLYVDRVFTLLLQWPHQPCVLCATVGSVRPVAPCAHLVCRECWDGADYSGCPICHRRVADDDPFLKPGPPGRPVETAAGPVRPLVLGTDAAADSVRALGCGSRCRWCSATTTCRSSCCPTRSPGSWPCRRWRGAARASTPAPSASATT